MTHEDEVTRAQDAAMILNSPLYKKAWEDIREGIINAMSQSPIGDEKTHNKLVIALQVVNKLQKNFETTIQTGELAELALERKKILGVF